MSGEIAQTCLRELVSGCEGSVYEVIALVLEGDCLSSNMTPSREHSVLALELRLQELLESRETVSEQHRKPCKEKACHDESHLLQPLRLKGDNLSRHQRQDAQGQGIHD
jgi:hypothetical protein